MVINFLWMMFLVLVFLRLVRESDERMLSVMFMSFGLLFLKVVCKFLFVLVIMKEYFK